MDTLVPEHSKNVLEWAKCVNQNYLMLCYMEDVKNILKVHDLESGNFLYNIPLEIGSIVGFSGKKEDKEVFFKFSSMITPGITYFMDMSQSPATPKVIIFFSIFHFIILLYLSHTRSLLQKLFLFWTFRYSKTPRFKDSTKTCIKSNKYFTKAKTRLKSPCLLLHGKTAKRMDLHHVCYMVTEASTFL